MSTKNHRHIPCSNLNTICKELTGSNIQISVIELANLAAKLKGWPELPNDLPHKKDYAKHYLYLYWMDRNKTGVYLGDSDKDYYVYLIQQGLNGPIKIGYTNNIEKRLISLRTGCSCPLNVIAKLYFKSKRLAYEYEQELHKQFAPYRLSGEWFSKRILARLSESRYDIEQKDEETIFYYVENKKNFPRKFKLEKKHIQS